MKTSRILGLAALIFAAPLFALAATVSVDKTVSVPGSQLVADNAYIAGGTVTFSTTAQKDLAAVGGRVTVNGPVWGDAMLAGGDVEILDQVRGDVRVAGGNIVISKSVGGDVIALGGTVTLLPGATVGGDVIALGGAVDIEGAVNGQVKARGGAITLDGTVAGPVTITAAKSVSFGANAVMGNTVTYSAPQEATVASGAKLGDKVTFEKAEGKAGPGAAGVVLAVIGFLFVAKFLGMLLAGLILVLAAKSLSQNLVDQSLDSFWKALGIGFVVLVVVPVAAVILAITVIGFYLAILLGLFYALALVGAGIYMCVLAGAVLSKWIKKEAVADWKWTILGTVVVFLIVLVPFVGWVADFALFLAALGTLASDFWRMVSARM